MEKVGIDELLEARKSLEKSVSQMVDATSKLLEPLKNLDDEQRDAVVMLGLLMRGIALTKRPSAKISKDVLEQFEQEINGICPPLGTATIAGDPCLEATASYMIALKQCEDEGRSEAECFEAWGHAAMSMMCLMEAIEEMKVEIEALLRRQKPPKPIPWPIERP